MGRRRGVERSLRRADAVAVRGVRPQAGEEHLSRVVVGDMRFEPLDSVVPSSREVNLERAFAVRPSPEHRRVRGDVAVGDPVREGRRGVARGVDSGSCSAARKSEDGRSEDQVRDPGTFLKPPSSREVCRSQSVLSHAWHSRDKDARRYESRPHSAQTLELDLWRLAHDIVRSGALPR